MMMMMLKTVLLACAIASCGMSLFIVLCMLAAAIGNPTNTYLSSRVSDAFVARQRSSSAAVVAPLALGTPFMMPDEVRSLFKGIYSFCLLYTSPSPRD